MKRAASQQQRERYTSVFDPVARRQLEKARERCREWSGEGGVAELDEELADALNLLEKFPYVGARRPGRIPGTYSKTRRRWPLDRSGYRIYYRVVAKRQLIVVAEIRHYARRPKPGL